eukprot:TRINITY_DN10684_c0_g2_i1.p3 TRINITY_DN10684_c0_g2~~TRINITY_DN10684_c0_g2_i1.p3  ORF type:complete len:198 (+),score=26.46 TRINITY_DN10684_c0_g2_i1:190-783(+)
MDGWRAHNAWSHAGLTTEYKDAQVAAGQIPHAQTYGMKSVKMKMAKMVDYVDAFTKRLAHQQTRRSSEAPLFVFDFRLLHRNERMQKDYDMPAFTKGWPVHLLEFSFGPPLSGAHPHFHNRVLASLVHGRKRWAMLPPAHSYVQQRYAREWFDSDEAKQPWVRHCIQRAGDMLWLPDNWAHITINIQTSVGVVHEYG